ncbi:3-phytase like protein [Verticillium longisporum]|uniref:3-phytase like protein n=1 Tax=Verticillium longisporum TaxID=100787 RepID=A0A8I3AQI8_VERLO|nr:3-phytase like protein [Verticillium longisporum]KAG7132462.1 3-phytase like protein [Verticillium longisporum]
MGLKPLAFTAAYVALATQPWLSAAVELQLNVTAYTSGLVESDATAVYYSESQPLLISNDGGASTGGFHTWDLDGDAPLQALKSVNTGRTKLVAAVHDVGGRDILVSIPATTSILSAYELPSLKELDDARFVALGDWSALCSWKAPSANNYVYLFGKSSGHQYLVREAGESVEFVEVQSFDVPTEFAGCAVSRKQSKLILTPNDGDEIHQIDLAESTSTPELSVLGKTEDTATGIAVYTSPGTDADYLFIAQEGTVTVYRYPFELVGTLALTGLEDIEVEGISLYQAATSKYPLGALGFAAEADNFEGFGLSSLENIWEGLGVEPNTEYDPRALLGCRKRDPICDACSNNGFCTTNSTACTCFSGFAGASCSDFTCQDNCSGRGTCVGPNVCQCEKGWGGLHCSFLLVEPAFETEANGNDGDDPAIWISPDSPEKSRIITTTKSEAGAGLGVFDLEGKLLQIFPAGQPNNVDVIYNFNLGNRTVDLAYAACRADDTLCLFEITADGVLKDIAGSSQPAKVEDGLYGSCVYRSRKTGKQYLFVNEKTARYMQYELTASANGTLETTLVREFQGGSGGQVEGCVSDEENGWVWIGEEPSALWRYDAEPDSEPTGVRVAYVGDGLLWGDVEGVTLVFGKTPEEGYLFVSAQGVSAYNVYRRASPHEYVMTFTLIDSADGQIDHVSNTDSLAAVGANLGPGFPHGLLVVHDDTNEMPGGGADVQASYKVVGLDKILGAEPFKGLNLLDGIDPNWDPRA